MWLQPTILAGLTEIEAKIAAIITGFAGIIAAVGGVLITLRKVKDREHNASAEQMKVVQGYLADERIHRIEAEEDLYQANVLLTQHGITPPKRAPSAIAAPPPAKMEKDESDDGGVEDIP